MPPQTPRKPRRQPTTEIESETPILAKHLHAVMAGQPTIEESEATAYNLVKMLKSPAIPRKFILVHPDEDTSDWGDLEWEKFEEGKSDNQMNMSMSREDKIIFKNLKDATGLTKSGVGRRCLAIGAVYLAGKLRNLNGCKEVLKLTLIPNDFLRALIDIEPGIKFDTDGSKKRKPEHILLTSKLTGYIEKNVADKIYGMNKASCYRLCWKAGIQFYEEDKSSRLFAADMVHDALVKVGEWEDNIEMVKLGFRSVIERWEIEKDDDSEYQSIGLSATPDHNRNKKWVGGQKN